MLWLQGFDQAPEMVKACVESWRRGNPGWDLVLLDESNLPRYVDVVPSGSASRESRAAFSDIVRINLLARHGGVWADADVFCSRPLDEWADAHAAPSGFFAFSTPSVDRAIASWFLVSSSDCYLTRAYCRAVNTYWNDNALSNQGLVRSYLARRLRSLLSGSQARARLWFSWPITKVLRIHPYFWFHYLFVELLATDEEFRRIWEASPRVKAARALKVRNKGLAKRPLTPIGVNRKGRKVAKWAGIGE